ncbi:SET methyltransferase domain containing protein [Nitzschia inconspicua]|uniref:SET methyltransferase domain containing protein n=1 Tax=Nitzschia inconspicua TaxID=303405 RepID=A0A9K3L7I9_9STRA|nr:SET methyltransferase domain containing protein [Nitzschia inconspicua]
MLGGIVSVLLAGASVSTSTFSSPSTNKDAIFTEWCHRVGIETPKAELRTTKESVAGRGVFASQDVLKGDVVLRIPEAAVLHNQNAALYFPETAGFLASKKQKILKERRRRQRWWDPRTLWRRLRPLPFEKDNLEFVDPSEDLWQMELTLFALDVLENASVHPWGLWVSEWYRDDPMQRLHQTNVQWKNSVEIDGCIAELQEMLPDANPLTLRAAVDLRLRRLNALKNLYDVHHVPPLDTIYGLVISRAIELGKGIAGVIPMFDMINHSLEPNLALSFDGSAFELIAQRNIAENEEMFICYTRDISETINTKKKSLWDEVSAVWTLVQWGIPTLPEMGDVKKMTIKSSARENQNQETEDDDEATIKIKTFPIPSWTSRRKTRL